MAKRSDESGGEVGLFDRFASRIDHFTSHATFFAFCVIIVVVWAPTLFLMPINTSQLIINTVTTIVTFLLVALLQNTQKRGMDALHGKLNVIAEALADNTSANRQKLRDAVGLEKRQGTKGDNGNG